MIKRKKARTEAQWKKLVGSDYIDSLNEIVDELFEMAYRRKWNWGRFADAAGVNYQTVKNLGTKKTRLPQFRTILFLCEALGGTLGYKKGRGGKVSLKITWTPELMAGRRYDKSLFSTAA